ncbi:hypothetical protein WJX82_007780 [Trebouxia sp. C0006]
MEVLVECAYCWQAYSPSTEDRIPRVLQCGHSLCTGCLGRVLTSNLRGGLRCPTCRQPHSFSEANNVAAVPRNFALIGSLEGLQLRGAAGGLLASKSLQFLQQLLGSSDDGKMPLAHAVGMALQVVCSNQLEAAVAAVFETPDQRPSLSQIKQVLEAVLHDEGEGDWSPSLRHQASLQFPDTIDPAVSVTVPIANRTCIFCSEEVVNDQAVHFISGCSHIMCVSCSVGYVRCTMDVATPDLYPFRCTGHRLVPSCSGQLVDISYLQLVSPQLLDEGVIPLSIEEIQRYNQQQVFAAIPAHQRIQCPYPTCQALLFNDDAPDFASQPAEGLF